MNETRVVITGGGTGGHIFPGLALAEILRMRLPSIRILFIGTKKRLEARVVPAEGWAFKSIASRGLKGMGIFRAMTNAAVLPLSLAQAIYRLARFWPRLVVGMGGYVAGPVVAAAWLLRRKVAIHEQNLTPGLTNRVLARLADLVMVSYPETRSYFPRARVIVTGNPVREKAVGKAEKEKDKKFRILVLGGSQGAQSLNRMMVTATKIIDRQDLKIIHQSGTEDEKWLQNSYAELSAETEVLPFIEDIGSFYRWADVVVCRAGATTMAELAVNGCAAVLVPFPGAADGHQQRNAQYAAEKGAALLVKDRGGNGGKDLAQALLELRAGPDRRKELMKSIRTLARPGAAKDMAQACLMLIGKLQPEKRR